MQASLIAPMKALSIKLPDTLFQDLALRAETSASSCSEIVRTALAAYLQVDASAPAASRANRARRRTGIVLKAVGPIMAGLRGALLRPVRKASLGKTSKERDDHRTHLSLHSWPK